MSGEPEYRSDLDYLEISEKDVPEIEKMRKTAGANARGLSDLEVVAVCVAQKKQELEDLRAKRKRLDSEHAQTCRYIEEAEERLDDLKDTFSGLLA